MGVPSELKVLSDAVVAAVAAASPKWNATWGYEYLSSGTVTATGDTGVVATPLVVAGDDAIFPIAFTCTGSDQAAAETNDVTIDFYLDAAGAHTVGTLTFVQMTAGDMLPPPLPWPGAVVFWDITGVGAMRQWTPLPPYHKVTHTLGGPPLSMSYIVGMSYLALGV